MNTATRLLFLLALVLAQAGCAGFDSGGVRDLTEAEITVLKKTRARLSENRASVQGALDDLADNLRFALEEQHRLTSNLAKAQLLETMKSPWTDSSLKSTQKEVALYHLFALAEAEQATLEARIEARTADINELKSSYGQLVSSMSALIAGQEQLLVHLNQPTSTQINLVLQQVFTESKAFREGLQDSGDPNLLRLADRVAERERELAEAEQRIVALLQYLDKE